MRLIKTWGGWRLNPSLPLRQIKHCIDIKYLQWWTSNFSIFLSSILPPTIWSTCFICCIKYPEHYDGIVHSTLLAFRKGLEHHLCLAAYPPHHQITSDDITLSHCDVTPTSNREHPWDTPGISIHPTLNEFQLSTFDHSKEFIPYFIRVEGNNNQDSGMPMFSPQLKSRIWGYYCCLHALRPLPASLGTSALHLSYFLKCHQNS